MLLGGEPGIGKSTLVIETAAGVATNGIDAGPASVLYASGEESAAQLHLRAERLGLNASPAGERIEVLATGEVDAILAAVFERTPDLLIVDSVQTLTVEGLEGPAGSLGQVRESTAAHSGAFARDEGVPVVLVGHVTKDGTPGRAQDARAPGGRGDAARRRSLRVAAPPARDQEPLRLDRGGRCPRDDRRRSSRGAGSRPRAFLGESTREAPGVAVAATLEGSRPLLIEVQALVAPASGYGMPRRTVAGIDANRLALLVAVLGRRAGINLANHDLYASLAGGASVEEPAVDLPLALALASSFRDRPVRPWHRRVRRGLAAGRAAPGSRAGAAASGSRAPRIPACRGAARPGGNRPLVEGLDVVERRRPWPRRSMAGLTSAAGTSGEG